MFNRDETLLMIAGVGPDLRGRILNTHPTGSNYTCSPPVTNTDIDFYVFPSIQLAAFDALAAADGWESCLSESGAQAYVNTSGFGTDWMAYRKGSYNMIAAFNYRHFARCVAATEMCKALNLLEKADRVAAHSLVHLDSASEIKLPANYYLKGWLKAEAAKPEWAAPSNVNQPSPMPAIRADAWYRPQILIPDVTF